MVLLVLLNCFELTAFYLTDFFPVCVLHTESELSLNFSDLTSNNGSIFVPVDQKTQVMKKGIFLRNK